MKRFRFKLEPLLQFRQHLEKKQQLEVARAHTAVINCEKLIEKYRQQAREATQQLDKEIETGIDASRILRYQSFLSGLNAVMDTEENRHKGLVAKLSDAQGQLARKSKAKKILENLKDRHQTGFYADQLKAAQKEYDEMALLKKNSKDAYL